ncbi:MAG: nuclear transport factor 2 family protein [Planctomycetota bacterium]|jgi:ketosteroid isomerase-like protein
MSILYKVIVVLACVSVVWAMQNDKSDTAKEQQTAIEKAILKVHVAMMKAAENLDAEALYSHVLDMNKGVIIQDGRVLKTRQEALNATKEGLQGLKDISYTYNQKHITLISPTVALWVADGTTSATIIEDGREINVDFAESIIFIQKDGQWKVFHAHRSVPNPR